MCSRIRMGPNILSQGAILSIIMAGQKTATMQWGLKYGLDGLVNLRSEKLHTTWNYISQNRCVLPVTGFIEKGKEFSIPGQPLLLGGLFSTDRTTFGLLTKEAEGVIKEVHHREPVIVNDFIDYFLTEYNPDFTKFVYPLRA